MSLTHAPARRLHHPLPLLCPSACMQFIALPFTEKYFMFNQPQISDLNP